MTDPEWYETYPDFDVDQGREKIKEDNIPTALQVWFGDFFKEFDNDG